MSTDPRVQRARELLSEWEDLRRSGNEMLDEGTVRDLLAAYDEQAAARNGEEGQAQYWFNRCEAAEAEQDRAEGLDLLRTQLSAWLTEMLSTDRPGTTIDTELLELRDWIDDGAMGDPPETGSGA